MRGRKKPRMGDWKCLPHLGRDQTGGGDGLPKRSEPGRKPGCFSKRVGLEALGLG